MWPFTINAKNQTGSAYNFTFTKLREDKPLPLSDFKGNVILVVNTASKCGFTPQYEGLEKLSNTYKDRGLVIIGVPSNDFGKQEPGTSEEIQTFCRINYGVTFPMAEKEIVTGDKAHPFYRWARKTLGIASAPKWNFHKYLIGRNGKLVDYFYSNTKPDAKHLVKAIEEELAK
ncbi:MAG: glutathione peroxidase [Alphaproteobacteria bacterium]|nr:glutathione peroxidase [Alphaproteobacteria bacterium]